MQTQDTINTMNTWGIRGKNPALMSAVEKALKVASYDVPVLITGENGTGKEVFHKILHDGSHRRHSKRLAINCGGLPEDTITSELFGHVKGAYTGSVSDRKGYFEEADGGTLFLDEVGDLPLSVQAKLLRVLENGEVIRMGSNEVRKVDVRIVAATNVDLKKAIREGKFREDLYFRLSTITIHVPALRDRREDIPTLFRYFASETAKRYNMPHKLELSEECRIRIMGYSWPGNVRQLRHLVEELSITLNEDQLLLTPEVLSHYLPDGGTIGRPEETIDSDDLKLMKMAIYELKRELDEVRKHLGLQTNGPKQQLALPPSAVNHPYNAPQTPVYAATDYDEVIEAEDVTTMMETASTAPSAVSTSSSQRPQTLDEIECQAIRDALRRNGGNKRRAAAELGVSERTIHRKIQDYGLTDESN